MIPRFRWLAAVGACALGTWLAACGETLPLAPAEQRTASAPLPAASRYIVELGASGAISSSLAGTIAEAGGRVLRVHAGAGLALVAGLSPQAADSLRSADGVRLILPDVQRQYIHDLALRTHLLVADQRARRTATPLALTDPRTAQFFAQQWNMTRIRADSAWQITSQGSGTSVFIIDSGVDTAHIDLVGRVDGTRSTSLAYAPTDTDMETPLPYGHDVAGHGTFVSSLIATNNLGVAGVAPHAQLVMVRVLDDSGSGDDFAVIDGILYAADHGADVINLSVGTYLDRSNSFDLALADLMQRAIDYATARGALVVAAAGNEAVNTNTATAPTGSYADSLHAPASGLFHVLSVGATGPINQQNYDQIAVYSNFGKAGVAVFAPGGNIVDTTGVSDLVLGACSAAFNPMCAAENRYYFGAGTSFASPLAAGEAAVIKAQASKPPTATALEQCVLTTADEINGVRPDTAYGFGRLDVVTGVLSSTCK